MVKNPPANAGDAGDKVLIPGLGQKPKATQMPFNRCMDKEITVKGHTRLLTIKMKK